ncbi:hypothetical protein K2173_022353 [Erythroxylum novogranatense]|uniref:Protein kinase domain-containing protein n=1 Tax=Erythroxylum novogranatense TaxID=1862640 RepID=A0AAV8TJK3_9ROSI|nr:hypothetical protein K2173_022353 [Erythroxylum novogranatense]
MNHFHIYEAIGRGKHSTVYKGRKKKTIEYFAIKSVDKSQKTKVLHEVRMLHSLDHQNVLKFYSWYETSAHLWLVLEYCVGGDLMALLRQDGKLPEDSIHGLALDLVRALQFLHSKGIIYGDLKPSNILLDENGHTKLCDFGLARKLSDISKTPSSMLPQAKRGTPSYMAPELFDDGGVHSYASDFWALGCVLYECYTGRPPFLGKEFTQLVKSILTDQTPPLPGNPSRPFANLINSLLVKDPAERIQWAELCEHAFWRTKISQVPLPPQPAFDNMIELDAKPCLSERNGDRSVQNRTPPKHREKDVKGTPKRDENREKDVKGTPKRDENSLVGPRGQETPIKGTAVGRIPQEKASGRVVEDKQKEASSASRRVNLLRLSRIAKSNLQRENEKENYRRPLPSGSENDSEVKIENTDMELDFEESTEDETHEEPNTSDNCVRLTEEVENNMHPLENFSEANMPVLDESKTNDQDMPPEDINVIATPPSASPQLKTPRTQEALGSALNMDSSKSPSSLSEVLWHHSDLSVRPVMPSRKADKISDVFPSLPFERMQPADFVKMSKEQLETITNRIVYTFNGNTSIGEKQTMVRYLEMLSSNADAANILTNGPVMLMLVKMLRLSKASALRAQLSSLIGLLIRHSTFIKVDLANSGILGALSDALKDNQDKVRRFSMAALGELLFYISTQSDQNRDNLPPESPSKDSRSTVGWQVPNSLISLVSSVLRKGEDDMTQLYALRTIENICSQGGNWVARFTSQDIISNLCYIYRAIGKQESMRLTAGSCLVRLARFNPPTIQSILEKLSFKDTASSLVKGSPREQQISLNLLNMAMLGSHMFTNFGRHLLHLADDKHFPKGKALMLMALLCKNGRRWLLHFFCNARLLSTVDRLAKEKDSYLQHCLDAFAQTVASTIPSLLDTISGDVHQMMAGRRQGYIRAALFPVVLHLLGSSTFKHRVVNHQVLQQLANLVKAVETPFQVVINHEFFIRCFLFPNIFTGEILPSLAALYKGNKDGAARFLCLKILFDVIVIFLNEPSKNGQMVAELKSISNTRFLPLYPTFIDDEEPIATYAQKLLVMLIEFNYIKLSDILHLKTVSQCFEFLLGDLSTANVNNVKLCLALASAPEMEPKLLSQLRVVRRIGNLLEFAYAKDMEDFLEPTLGLCRAFLLRSVGNKRGFAYRNKPALLNDTSSDITVVVDKQQCVKDIIDFGSNVGVLLELSGFAEANVADIASECVVLLLKAAPREATTGFLTNLPKVTVILERWYKGLPHLILQRMLHALGYSCRQYLSHAMILSISIHEISRIELITSEIKTSASGNPDLAHAALLASSELQLLPRCR